MDVDSQLSRFFLLSTSAGSPYYMGPELSLGKGYGPEMDIWSCGVLLFAMLR